MKTQCLQLLTEKHYPTARCIDGILLFLPLQGTLDIHSISKVHSVTDDFILINDVETYQISQNGTCIMLYIASDWFEKVGVNFFDYKYIINLIQSTNEIMRKMLQLAHAQLTNTLTETQFEQWMTDIVQIIVDEAKINASIVNQHLNYTGYGKFGEILEYIFNHLPDKLTLSALSEKLYISKSNISGQFYNVLGIGVKHYVDSIRIASSMRYLIGGNHTLEEISEQCGFSNGASYSKKFKAYIGVSPNDYRNLDKSQKVVHLATAQERHYDEETLLSLINDKAMQCSSTSDIRIDEGNPKSYRPCCNVLQIYTVAEMKKLFLEDFTFYRTEASEHIIFYCLVDARALTYELTEEEQHQITSSLLENQLSIAFRINSKEDLHWHLECLWPLVKRTIEGNDKLTKEAAQGFAYIFNLATMDLKTIYRHLIHMQNYNFQVDFGIDITYLLNQPTEFKQLEAQLKRINFKYYFIDNARLNPPYLVEDSEQVLTKQLVHFTNIKDIIQRMDIDDQKYFLLNLENRLLSNDQIAELMDSPPILMEMLKETWNSFGGIGVDLFQQLSGREHLYLYDKNGFSSVLNILLHRFLELEDIKLRDYGHYIVAMQEEKVTIYIYDWRILEGEVLDRKALPARMTMDIQHSIINGNHLIYSENFDGKQGNINQIVPSSLRDKYEWSTPLVKKIEQFNQPQFEIFEHDFSQSTLEFKLHYNSVRIMHIFKNEQTDKF